MKARLLFASLMELPKRLTNLNKGLAIIFNDEDNDYPERVERLIDNSITAKQCRKLFRQFLTGKGITAVNEVIVNKEENTKLFKFINRFNQEYATQCGSVVHVMYNLKCEPVSYKSIPFAKVRKGKKDDKEYNGMYALCDDWSNSKKTDIQWIHAFNPRKEIIEEQISKAGGINKYKGQIFYFNPSNTDYPLAHIHPVLNDTDSEFRAGVFKNKSLRKGFFGKNILVTPPKIDPNLTTVDPSHLSEDDLKDLRHQERTADETTETLKGFVGVENHEGFMVLEMEFEGDKIENALKHIQIKSDIDDKLFAYTEESASNNIRKSYNNVPIILVDSSDKSLFGNSGEAILQAKLFYQEQTEEERMLIQEALKELFKNYKLINTDDLVIEPLIKIDNGTD